MLCLLAAARFAEFVYPHGELLDEPLRKQIRVETCHESDDGTSSSDRPAVVAQYCPCDGVDDHEVAGDDVMDGDEGEPGGCERSQEFGSGTDKFQHCCSFSRLVIATFLTN